MVKRLLRGALAAAVALTGVVTGVALPQSPASAAPATYEIYPQPQSIEYGDSTFIIRPEITAVYDETVDLPTQQRIAEAGATLGATVTPGDAPQDKTLSILVGSQPDSLAAQFLSENGIEPDASFNETDAYILAIRNGTVAIYGSDVDAQFYGATTLYHIFAQLDSLRVTELTIRDHADVVSRGFIEGYYGNPWSWQDRMDLMTWGGYYKLNSYFYAPKDDPKHNRRWRDLYTEEELEHIRAAAEAGNNSKVRFVYALHPLMSQPIRFGNDADYQEDFAILTAKYSQVIEAGVRQISVLADDAANVGAANYQRLLTDLVAFVKEKKKDYPDLKTIIPFCVQEYGGNGEGYFSKFPEEIQIIMTGGRVWGEVSQGFTNRFTTNVGRGPYLWINWPCTDNSNRHLIMGGYKDFLHPNVDPNKLEGIVLNPMEHSEPSKVAIFGNAAYSWNIWTSGEQADAAWAASFSHVDHHTAIDTAASQALGEISRHMINQAMDSRVRVLHESVELAPKLTAFLSALEEGTADATQADELINEFTTIRDAAQTFIDSAATAKMAQQMEPWLKAAVDSGNAAIAFLQAWKADEAGDVAQLADLYEAGVSAFRSSTSHQFISKMTQRVTAEFGVQHIVPFLKKMNEEISARMSESLDPNSVIRRYITSREDTPEGAIDNVFDGKPGTEIVYKNPANIPTGTYAGVQYSKPITLNSLRFNFGRGANPADTFAQMKLEVTLNGTDWVDLEPGKTYDTPGLVEVTGLDMQVMGVRAIATKDQNNKWFGIKDLLINPPATDSGPQQISGTYSLADGLGHRGGFGPLTNMGDGDDATEAYFAHDPYDGPEKDSIVVGAKLVLTFDNTANVGKVTLKQGLQKASDVLQKADLQIRGTDGTWTTVGTITSAQEQVFTVDQEGTALRIVNKQHVPVWWRVSEFTAQINANAGGPDDDRPGTLTKVDTTVDDNELVAKHDVGSMWIIPGTITVGPGEYIGLKLDAIRALESLATSITPTDGIQLQTSLNGLEWSNVPAPNAGADQLTDARYVRALNTTDAPITLDINKFEISYAEVAPISVTSNIEINAQWGSGDMRLKDNVANAFDGKLDTSAIIGGYPIEGSWVLFDLGRTRSFDSFRYYVVESTMNYLRDGVFEVSSSPDGPWTEILEVGDGEPNGGWDSTVAKDATYLTHDSTNPGNMYAEATDLGGVKGRYLRLRITHPYNYRFVQFNELQINGGEYLSPSVKRDFVGDVTEVPYFPVDNALDTSLTSSFKPAAESGVITYRPSEPFGKNALRIISVGEPSGAKVTGVIGTPKETGRSADAVRTRNRQAGFSTQLGNNETLWTRETVELGSLDQTLTEFVVGPNQVILEASISWDSATKPEISRVILSRQSDQVDKSALEAAIAVTADAEGATADSRADYDKALAAAKSTRDSAYVSQASVDAATAALNTAREALVPKADPTALQALVDENLTNPNNEIYQRASYAVYDAARNQAISALEDPDNLSASEAKALYDSLEQAKNDLTYSWKHNELSVLAAGDADKLLAGLNTADYTEASLAAVQEALTKVKDLLASDQETDRVYPLDHKDARDALATAIENLVNIAELRAETKAAKAIDTSVYEPDSVARLNAAIEQAEAAMVNGSEAEVAAALTELQEAKAGLTLSEQSGLEKHLANLEALPAENYTDDSYAHLMAEIAEIRAAMAEPLSSEQIQALKQRADEAEAALVSLVALKAKEAEAEARDLSGYTEESAQAVRDALAAAKALHASGTEQEVADALAALDEALANLAHPEPDPEPTDPELEQALADLAQRLAQLAVTDGSDYTDQSYKNLMDTVSHVREGMTGEVTAEQVAAFAKQLDEAEEALVSIAELKAKEAQAEAIDLSGYTEDSAQALRAAVAAAKALHAAGTEEQVAQAIADIDGAIAGLTEVIKPGPDPSEPGGDSPAPDPSEPGGDSPSPKPSEPGDNSLTPDPSPTQDPKPGAPGGPSAPSHPGKLPNSGASQTGAIVIAALSLLALGGTTLLMRRKRDA